MSTKSNQVRPLPPLPPKPKPAEDNDGYEVPIKMRKDDTYDSLRFSSDFDRKLLVSNLPEPVDEVMKETLELYFESKRNFGKELTLDNVELDIEAKEAILTYKSSSDAKHVLEKHKKEPCELQKKALTIQLYTEAKTAKPEESPVGATGPGENYSDDYTHVDSKKCQTDTIEVRGFGEDTSQDTLQYYFENKLRSGGGETKNFVLKRDEGYALITYKSPSVVESVIAMKHTVQNRNLSVRPFVISRTELILLELPDHVSEESISNFLEAKLQVEIQNVIFNQDKSKALVQFVKNFDMEEVKKACSAHQISGTNVVPLQVPVSNGILAYNLPENVTYDAVSLYFANSRKSGGGEVQDVENHFDDGYCIVYFTDAKVTTSVCEKKAHQLFRDKDPIKVMPYNKFFGLPAGCEISPFTLPEPVSLKNVDSCKLKFLKGNKAQKTKFQSELKKLHADVSWNNDPVEIFCTLTTEDKNNRQSSKTWKNDVLKLVDEFTDILVVKKRDIDGEMWQEVMSALLAVHLQNPDAVALVVEKENLRLAVVAHTAFIDETFKEIETAVAQVEKTFKEKKSAKTESKEISAWKVKYLKAAGFKTDIQSEQKGVTIELEEKGGKGQVIVKGPAAIIPAVFVAMYDRLQQVKTSTVKLCGEKIRILSGESTTKYVKNLMSRQNVSDIWELNSDSVVLHADEDSDLRKMEDIINNAIVQFSIDLDSGTTSALKSQRWKDAEKTLLDKNSGCVIITPTESKLEIYTRADLRDDVSKELESFMSANSVYKEEYPLSAPHLTCFQGFLKDTFEKQLSSLQKRGVNIKINFDKKQSAAYLKGNSEGLKEGKSLLKKLEGSVKNGTHTIKHRKVRTFLARHEGQDCIKKVETNIPCVIDMGGSGFKTSIRGQQYGSRKFDRITECAEASLAHDVKIVVVGGDITEVQADVLVNAANKDLKHVGGLAAVIVQKGGHEIQKECDRRIEKKGTLKDGHVFMSNGGNLQCKFVAHAVGPHWRDGQSGEEAALQTAVLSCLEKSEKNKAKSIAMPALSSGIFGYPVDMACLAIIKAVVQHFQSKGKKTSIKKVLLCDISQVTVGAFTAALQNVVHNVKVMVNVSTGDGPKPSWVINTDKKDRGDTGTGIGIEVVKDVLANEKVDVIVNSTSPDLQLKRGALSSALLKAGGDIIQQECDQNYPNGINTGDVAVTTSGNLACSNIFHVALKHYDRNNYRQSLKGIENCVQSCLEEAEKLGFSSVAFPAVGTGAQKYPRDKVAKEMFRTVTTYGKDNPQTSVRNVRFVVYTEDDETFEAFLTEEKNWNKGSVRPSSGRRSDSAGSSRRNAGHGFGQLLKESSGKADFKIGNLTVSVYSGDITDEDTTAIIASCNRDLDLSKGAVTKAIVQKGGQAIEQDCQKQRDTMRNEGVAVTTAGKLRSKYIIHVDTKYKTWEWKPVVLLTLQKAEKHQFASIAFPALGTSVGCKPEDIAELMYSAFVDFNKDKPNHLQEVRIVIFKDDMVSGFIDGMKNGLSGRPLSGGKRHGEDQRQSRSREHQHKHQHDQSNDQDDTCTVTIYAEDDEKVKKAKKLLVKSIEDEWIVKKIEEEGIHRLQFNDIKSLRDLAARRHIDLTVDNDLGVIELIGRQKDVSDIIDKVFGCIRSCDRSFYLKGQAQLMSNIVKWLYLKDNRQNPFPPRVNLEIEQAYKNKDKNVKVKDRSGGEYMIDFGNMEEFDVKQPNQKFPVIRRDLIEGASFEIPKSWQPMNKGENLKLVTLKPADSEYQKVLQEFTGTLGRSPNIVKIERIQNATLFTQYCAKRKEMNMKNKQQKNEKVLWHGTAHDSVDSINAHGFNRSYCGKNATAIGQGVYFAVQSSYSDQPTYSPPGRDGNKRMYRCLVLTGTYCTGSSAMRVPPPINNSQPHILYDSVTNNTSNPIMFVVFNDTQAYPEYIITYR